jgi:predicted RNA binding protein YcfA (HicA-like mRNA interferase family)
MPPKLPQKFLEINRKLLKLGFEIDRMAGSHVVYKHPITNRRAVVPKHVRELPKGTVKAIVRESGIDIQEFLAA